MTAFELISFLVVITALLSYINHRYIKLPQTIGLMTLSLLFSLLIFPATLVFPGIVNEVKALVNQFEFSKLVLDILLCYLLFAGAFHTNYNGLKKEMRNVASFALLGTILCTLMVGFALHYALTLFDIYANIWSCLLFGALISPTDPIAVLGILTKSKIPDRIKTNIIGESLFNDGIGVVLFISIAQIVANGVNSNSFNDFIKLFALEAFGGIVFGIVLGYVVYFVLKSIDHYPTELMVTLAAVTAGYALAHYLHVSGPLAMVVVGLITGSRAREDAMSIQTESYIDKFWEMIDELLNAFLFVLIGMEVLVVRVEPNYWPIAAMALIIVLIARYASIKIPYLFRKKSNGLPTETPLLMTWGGLRGGISIAMALAIDKATPEKDLWIFITYLVVIFSITIQASTLPRLIKRIYAIK